MSPPSAGPVAAPAKINLALHVCGRRADGYHLLDSLVVFAGIGDRVTVRSSETLTLSLAGPFAAALNTEPDNLVLRAARWFAAKAGVAARGDILLEKNLPVASGIGGGSSDAAAALRACAALWNVDLGLLSDRETAAALGADVPVCLARKPAMMRGIGEEIAPVAALPPAWLVLANPGRPLATKDVFAALKGRFAAHMEPLPAFSGVEDFAGFLGRQRNDLTAPAVACMPEIDAVLEAIQGASGALLARLSGSGATCFGLFATENRAREAAQALSGAHPAWWVAPAAMMTGPMADNR